MNSFPLTLHSFPRAIVHIDADAFFASVEIRDKPELRGKPVIIGMEPPSRGVVSTCSYEARKYGVRSGMPVKVAQKLCPNGIFVKPDIKKYTNVSNQIFKLLKNFCSYIYQTGIDEGFLDLSGMIPLYSSYEELIRTIKQEIYKNHNLTCSIGVSSCPLISKVASDRCKPAGYLILGPEEEEQFIMLSPVETIPFFGKKTVNILNKYKVFYFKDLYNYELSFLERELGYFIDYYYLKWFLKEDLVREEIEAKSFSTETTFEQDIEFNDDVFSIFTEFAQELAQRLRDEGYKSLTITTKVRDENFKTFQKQLTLEEATCNENIIANLAFQNMDKIVKSKIKTKKIRLIGLKVSGLIKDSDNLFDIIEKDDIIYKKIDELNKKYNKPIVRKGIVWRKKD